MVIGLSNECLRNNANGLSLSLCIVAKTKNDSVNPRIELA